MTPEQATLAAPLFLGVLGFFFIMLQYLRKHRGRGKGSLRESMGRWTGEGAVPTEAGAIPAGSLEAALGIEEDPLFKVVFKKGGEKVQRQYDELRKARNEYMRACNELYDRLRQDCSRKTGLFVGSLGQEKGWPDRLLLPGFVDSVYGRLMASEPFPPEAINYYIERFTYGSVERGIARAGVRLSCEYPARSFELAEVIARPEGEGAARGELEKMQGFHQQMTGEEYGVLFAARVSEIRRLRENADRIWQEVKAALGQIQAS